MKIVISQPRYLPALNYLQRLYFADQFVVLDIVQRQPRGWENRNKLLLPQPIWLTIPVSSSSRALIIDSKISGQQWIKAHKEKIIQHYKDAPHFNRELLDRVYTVNERLSGYTDVLLTMTKNTCRFLSFEPKLVLASNLLRTEDHMEKGVKILRRICDRIGADCYVSGPNGREYGVAEEFLGSGITLVYHEFTHPIYPQRNPPFVPYMGFLDALFFCGVDWLSQFVRTPPEFLTS
jgi:hypothetical protein